MDSVEYRLLREVQDLHWWWRGRAALIERLLKRYIGKDRRLDIADLGAGAGANIGLLLPYGQVAALELNSDCLRHIAATWPIGVELVPWTMPQPLDRQFDLILLADVLEHIEDDVEAVAWISRHLRPGGIFVMTVPAHRWMWTEMDEEVGHFRRYSKRQLTSLIAAHFSIKFISYYNALLWPAKALFVLFSRLSRTLFPERPKRSHSALPPAPLNALLRTIMTVESAFIDPLRLPFGISLVVIAQK